MQISPGPGTGIPTKRKRKNESHLYHTSCTAALQRTAVACAARSNSSGLSSRVLGWREIVRGVSHETVYRRCLTQFAGTRTTRHKKHLTSALLIGQSTPVLGYDHQRQGPPGPTLSGWFSLLYGAGFTVLSRGKHHTSTLSTSSNLELNKTTAYVPRSNNIQPTRASAPCLSPLALTPAVPTPWL